MPAAETVASLLASTGMYRSAFQRTAQAEPPDCITWHVTGQIEKENVECLWQA